jgi:hypothetical protein
MNEMQLVFCDVGIAVIKLLLYLLYTADLPVSANTTMGTFADGTVILSANKGCNSYIHFAKSFKSNTRVD